MTNTEAEQLRKIIEIIVELAQSHPNQDMNDFLEYNSGLHEIVKLFHSHEAQIKQDIFKKVEGLIGSPSTIPWNMLANSGIAEYQVELRASLKALEEKEEI